MPYQRGRHHRHNETSTPSFQVLNVYFTFSRVRQNMHDGMWCAFEAHTSSRFMRNYGRQYYMFYVSISWIDRNASENIFGPNIGDTNNNIMGVRSWAKQYRGVCVCLNYLWIQWNGIKIHTFRRSHTCDHVESTTHFNVLPTMLCRETIHWCEFSLKKKDENENKNIWIWEVATTCAHDGTNDKTLNLARRIQRCHRQTICKGKSQRTQAPMFEYIYFVLASNWYT